MSDVIFAIDAKSVSATQLDVSAREFTFSVDEPAELGGKNTGPNPVEYLLGALAGCLNIVGHLVAAEMGFPIEELTINISGNLDPMGFLGKKSDVRPGFQEVRVQFNARTTADKQTLSQWLKAVQARCPVSDNIEFATPMQIAIESR